MRPRGPSRVTKWPTSIDWRPAASRRNPTRAIGGDIVCTTSLAFPFLRLVPTSTSRRRRARKKQSKSNQMKSKSTVWFRFPLMGPSWVEEFEFPLWIGLSVSMVTLRTAQDFDLAPQHTTAAPRHTTAAPRLHTKTT